MITAALSTMTGLNNRATNAGVPNGRARNAVNVDFNMDGTVSIPRMGVTRVLSGTSCHSWYQFEHALGYGLFVDGSVLYRLNLNLTATAIATIGNTPVSYYTVGDFVYFANATTSGIYSNGSIHPWGVETPNNQPTATPVSFGGLFAGEYLVAITYVSEIAPDVFQESGTVESIRVTVTEGGGIQLTDFPVPPDYVTSVVVYTTAVNDSNLCLFGEYEPSVEKVLITSGITTVELSTQFGFKPQPKKGLVAHKGRIYWIDGTDIRFTEPHNYGLQRALSYFPIAEEVSNLIPYQDVMYVATDRSIYAIIGIDTDAVSITKVKNYGAPAGAVFRDIDNSIVMITHQCFIVINAEGIRELAAPDVALPIFKYGTMAVVENNGSRKAIAVCQEGTVSPLQNPDYTAAEVTRHNTGL